MPSPLTMGAPAVREPRARAAATPWRAAAWLFGAFTLTVGVFLLAGHIQAKTEDPLNSQRLKDLKETLRATPTDDQVKTRIRALDLELRQRYFNYQRRTASGVWLLLAGAGLLVLCASRAASLSRKPVLPCLRKSSPEANTRTSSLSRTAVASVGVVSAAGFLWLAQLAPRSEFPVNRQVTADPRTSPTQRVEPDCATPAELAREWPWFRGPAVSGTGLSANPPIHWNAETGENIAWKTEVPAAGFNSPLVFGGHVYFSGGNASNLEVFCLRLADGNIAWRQPVTVAAGGSETAEIPESTGYSPATMATDGRRVYAIFANGNLAAFALDGKPAWSKSFGALKNAYGHATSLMTWRDRLIVQLDQGDSEDGKSVLYAFEGPTGKPVWQRPRKLGASWASPIVVEPSGKAQILTLSLPWLISYSATDGAEIWRADCLNGEVTPSPIFAGGLVVVASPSDRIVAFRPDGAGDVSKTHLAWSFDEDIPDVTSPVSNGELVFTVTTEGLLTCLDLKDGKKLWSHELEIQCHASPVIAGNRLYQLGQDGTVLVVEAAREFKELSRTKMPDAFHATPAFVQDRIVLRGMTNIWCIGGSGKAAARTP